MTEVRIAPDELRRDQINMGRKKLSINKKFVNKRIYPKQQPKIKQLSSQDKLLKQYKEENVFIDVIDITGEKHTGKIIEFDNYTILIENKYDTRSPICFYKNGIIYFSKNK